MHDPAQFFLDTCQIIDLSYAPLMSASRELAAEQHEEWGYPTNHTFDPHPCLD
jgi:hypothetical protein